MKKPYKLDKLTEFVGKDERQIKEMISIFLDTIPPDIKKLEKMAVNEEWQKIYEIAHKTKPSFGIFEMNDILKNITEIEKLTRENINKTNLITEIKEVSEKVRKIILLLQMELEK